MSADYYRRRLVQSQERAALSPCEEARAVHDELARRYAALLAGEPFAPADPPAARARLKLVLPPA